MKFHKNLERLSSRHSRSRIFSDFLAMGVCALSMQTQEELYFKTIEKYDREELYLFCEAFALLVVDMDNNGEGLKDCLGGYFQEYISNGNNGQFFTPVHICDLMADLASSPENFKDGETVIDSTAGSGRTLLAAAKRNRNLHFFAADISLDCCYMSIINFCLNNLSCEVWWMDSLSRETYGAWRIRKNYLGVCSVVKLEINDIKPTDIKPIEIKTIEENTNKADTVQLLLDFVA